MTAATIRRTSSFLLLLILCAAPFTARSETAARAPRKSSPATSPSALAERLCDALQTLPETRKAACCANSPTSGIAAECTRVLASSLHEKAITLEPADVERCAAATAQQLAGCEWVTPYAPRVPQSCRDVLHGQRAVGSGCRSSLECVDGAFCWGSGPTTPGICARSGGVGTTCGGAIDALATYARQTGDGRHPECAGFCSRGRCAAFLPPGSACSASEQCGPDGHCAAGRCAAGPLPKLGEPCAGTTCGDDLVCVAGQCAAPKKSGDACTNPRECEATCLPGAGSQARVCGLQCSAWPPAGYTPAVAVSQQPRG